VLAERHVALARRIVSSQKRVVAELHRDAHPTRMARKILASYEALLQLHVADRDRLKKELSEPTNRLTSR